MADKKKMSVEDILAACRKADAAGGSGPSASEAKPKAESPQPKAEAEPAESGAGEVTPAKPAGKPAAKPAGKPAAKPADKPAAAKPGSMSINDILAAARAQKGGAEAAPAAAAKPAAEKPKPAAAKPAVKADAPAPKAAPVAAKDTAAKEKDTTSILAAARKAVKPGPMSKAEAEAKAKPVEEKGKKKLEVPPMPAKPDYAKPRPVAPPAAQGETRRGFFRAVTDAVIGSPLAIGFSSLAVTHLLWGLGLARFMFPNVLTEPPTRFKVGFPDDYGPGQVENKFKAQFGVWIVRDEYEGQPQIFALQTVCTHLGCTPNWLEGEQKYKCPCHGSGFYKDGINFEGPAPRPLERFAIRISDDGQLEVDKSRKFQEELGQWKDPASFVVV